MTRIGINIERFLLYFFIATKRMLKQTEPIFKTWQHKESFKMQKSSTVTQYLLSMSFSMPIWKRKSNGWVYEMLWVVPPEVRKKYLVKCLQTKQPISFVKDAAADLASYSVRFSWTFASELKCQFLSLLVKYSTKLHPVLFSLYIACF